MEKPMKLSNDGADFIKSFEGCRLEAYDDLQPKVKITDKSQLKGVLTIGYGHTGPDVKVGMKITKQQADELFAVKIQSYVNAVNKYVKVELNQNQFDALVSFTYNLGPGALQKSTMLQLINYNNFTKAAGEFIKYVHAGNKVLQGLVRRREAEKKLFLTEPPKPKLETKQGQIGTLYILKKINLWKRVNGKLQEERVLQPNDVYRVYSYDDQFGGQYGVGNGFYVTNMAGYVRYEKLT